MARRVVLLCGPPGAGKTTWARRSGLTVYDRDDHHWRTEAHFAAAIKQLRHVPDAQAVVIRAGAAWRTRARTSTLIGATEVVVLDTAPEVCIRRIIARDRPGIEKQIAGVRTWWAGYQPIAPPRKDSAKYSSPEHKAERARWTPVVAAGEAHCAEPVCLMPSRWIPPGSAWDVAHDPSGTRYIGPAHARCNRSEGARRGNRSRGVQPAQAPAPPASRWWSP